MSDYNNENEQRIHDMIARFREEMAKARDIAQKAAEEAEAVIKEAVSAAEDAAKDAGKDAAGAADNTAETVRENAREFAREAEEVGDAFLSQAKKAFEEAEAKFEEARRAYAEAKKQAAEEEKSDEDGPIFDREFREQAKANLDELAKEAGDALKVAWGQLKKGWKELKDASSDPVEWLKDGTRDARESLKDAFRDMKEGLKAMMDDLGDAGDAENEDDGEDRRFGLEWKWHDGEDEDEYVEEEEFRATSAAAARESIENEMNDVQKRVGDMLSLVREQYDEGNIDFDKYFEYTDKYTAYLHDRLVELRNELKKL